MSILAATRRALPLGRKQLITTVSPSSRLLSSSSFKNAEATYTPLNTDYNQPRPLNLYVKSTRNNTIMSLVGKVPQNGQQGTFFNVSGGTAGFKKVQRSGYEAGYQCAVKMFAAIDEMAKTSGPIAVTLLFNGFGQGREAMTRALNSPDGEKIRSFIVRVTDRTPIAIGGVRPKKKRTL